MGLRLMLVGLVASLGLDLPTKQDVDRWADSGRGWVCSALGGWNRGEPGDEGAVAVARLPEGLPELPPVAVAEQGLADEAFEAVMSELAASFAADLADSGPDPAPGRAVAFEPVEIGDDLYPGLAYELNRLAEVSRVPEPPTPAVASLAESPAPEATTPIELVANPRCRRLAHALHLTGDALHAWATLLQGPAVVSVQP